MIRSAHPGTRPATKSWALAALALATGLSACATQTVTRSGSSGGDVAGAAPVISVERFLRAVEGRDLGTMAQIFGTVEGPFKGNAQQVELQMDLLATVLAHERYEIISEAPVAGRMTPTTRVGVTLTLDDRTVPDVGFITVRTADGRWMVQEIDTEKVTRRGRAPLPRVR